MSDSFPPQTWVPTRVFISTTGPTTAPEPRSSAPHPSMAHQQSCWLCLQKKPSVRPLPLLPASSRPRPSPVWKPPTGLLLPSSPEQQRDFFFFFQLLDGDGLKFIFGTGKGLSIIFLNLQIFFFFS